MMSATRIADFVVIRYSRFHRSAAVRLKRMHRLRVSGGAKHVAGQLCLTAVLLVLAGLALVYLIPVRLH